MHRRFVQKNGGQTVLIVTVMFLFIGTIVVLGASVPASRDASAARELASSKQTMAVADAGIEDVSYRVRKGKAYSAVEVLTLAGATATTTTVDNVVAGSKEIRATSTLDVYVRKQFLQLVKGDAVSFNYGVQAGAGGLVMSNSSLVLGNVYSNGTITGVGNFIKGAVISAGPFGLLSNIHATSTVWAHTITSATVDGDAHYQVISGSTVGGTLYPGSSDRSTTAFPISDDQIDEWEQEAASGGVISSPCPYIITSPTTLGGKKIDCDFQVKGTTLTLTGPIWVRGNISFTNAFHIRNDPSTGSKQIMIIADDPANRTSGSKITVSNSGDITNNGTTGTAIFLISANTSAEQGGSVSAIDMGNSVDNDAALYSNHGLLNINQSGKIYMATGYKINLSQSAQLIYNAGIENSLFDTGPGGSWNVYSIAETQ